MADAESFGRNSGGRFFISLTHSLLYVVNRPLIRPESALFYLVGYSMRIVFNERILFNEVITAGKLVGSPVGEGYRRMLRVLWKFREGQVDFKSIIAGAELLIALVLDVRGVNRFNSIRSQVRLLGRLIASLWMNVVEDKAHLETETEITDCKSSVALWLFAPRTECALCWRSTHCSCEWTWTESTGRTKRPSLQNCTFHTEHWGRGFNFGALFISCIWRLQRSSRRTEYQSQFQSLGLSLATEAAGMSVDGSRKWKEINWLTPDSVHGLPMQMTVIVKFNTDPW